MSDQTLTLGTNFQADVKSFADGVKQVRDLLKSLRGEVEQVSQKIAAINSAAGTQGIKNLSESSKKASAGFRTLYGDMSELQKALGRTDGLSGKYSATLSNLTRGMDKNSLSIKDAEKAMYSTDKVLRTLNRSFSTQLEQAASGTRSWDNLASEV
jgi:methyl-accepting chemotaxis protein